MSVFKRGKHWHFTKTIDGVRYRQALKTARTKTQAEEAERDLLSKIHEGTYGRPSGSAVFIDFAEKVYLPWSRENKRSTNDQYHIKTFKVFFKRKTFSEISPMTIEKFKSERRKTPTKFDKPRSAASVNRELECLSSIFSMAMRKPHRLINENPCREVDKLREENRRFRYLSSEEEKRLLAACTDDRTHLRNIILVAINTGMRRGEILSLKWSQVDFARGLIHLVRTKSGKSRLVPINSIVREVLLELSSKRLSDYVFTSDKTGRALTQCKHAFAYACREAGITDLRFHDLRHTAATRLMEMGADPSTIKEILGHSDLRMTDRYTHAVEARKREALERISSYGAEVIQIKERRKS